MTDRERDASILQQRRNGEPMGAIAQRYSLTPQRIGQIAYQEAERQIDDLIGLLEANRDGDDAIGLAVPFQQADGWKQALDYLQFCLDGLRRRGRKVSVTTRPTSEGTVFFLTLTD